MNENKMKAFKIPGIIFIAASVLGGLCLYIVSFSLWADWLGFWGYIVAFFFAPDIVLIVKRIIDYGFKDWYFLMSIGSTVLLWLGSFLMSKADDS